MRVRRYRPGMGNSQRLRLPLELLEAVAGTAGAAADGDWCEHFRWGRQMPVPEPVDGCKVVALMTGAFLDCMDAIMIKSRQLIETLSTQPAVAAKASSTPSDMTDLKEAPVSAVIAPSSYANLSARCAAAGRAEAVVWAADGGAGPNGRGPECRCAAQSRGGGTGGGDRDRRRPAGGEV